jgi:F0F1-type ATP synthase assembly protein I
MAPRLGKQADIWGQVAYYSGLGFIIPGGAVGGYSIGWLLSGWLHTGQWLALVVGLVGAAGGLVEVLQILTRAEKRQSGKNSDSGNGSS